MPHVHNNPGEHDSTVSAFIVRTDRGQPQLLVHMHKKLGILLMPGGHVELKETPWDAIRHEITEETGYELSQLSLLQPPSRLKVPFTDNAVLHPQPVAYSTHPFGLSSQHYHTDVAFAFITDGAPEGKPDAGESPDLRWIDVNELATLTDEHAPQNMRAIGVFVLTTVLNEWDVVDLAIYK